MHKRIELLINFGYMALTARDIKRLSFGVNSLKRYKSVMSADQLGYYIDLAVMLKIRRIASYFDI